MFVKIAFALAALLNGSQAVKLQTKVGKNKVFTVTDKVSGKTCDVFDDGSEECVQGKPAVAVALAQTKAVWHKGIKAMSIDIKKGEKCTIYYDDRKECEPFKGFGKPALAQTGKSKVFTVTDRLSGKTCDVFDDGSEECVQGKPAVAVALAQTKAVWHKGIKAMSIDIKKGEKCTIYYDDRKECEPFKGFGKPALAQTGKSKVFTVTDKVSGKTCDVFDDGSEECVQGKPAVAVALAQAKESLVWDKGIKAMSINIDKNEKCTIFNDGTKKCEAFKPLFRREPKVTYHQVALAQSKLRAVWHKGIKAMSIDIKKGEKCTIYYDDRKECEPFKGFP